MCIHVCASCEVETAEGSEPAGQALYTRLRLAAGEDVLVRAAPCFAVCERPVTVAFGAPGKWTYVIGDVAADIDPAKVFAAAAAVARAPSGVPPLPERPRFFRHGVVARVPPQPE